MTRRVRTLLCAVATVSAVTPSFPAAASSSPVDPAAAPTTTTTTSSTAVSSTANPNAGAAPLGSTSYPVPSDALYVSPSGRDTNAGTRAAPLATIAKAVSLATNGRTIVLRAGVYHESVTAGTNHQVTIENYPGETVWLDGTSVVPGWTKSGSTWVHTGWNHHFDHTPGYSAASASVSDWLDPAYPMAAHPDQVWVGSTWLRQVASASQVVAGTFFYDEPNNRLVIGSDPTGKTVLASSLGTALTLQAPGSIVRGIGIRRYATSLPDGGALRLWGAGQRAENVLLSEIATEAMTVSADHVVVNHMTASYNGFIGLKATESYYLTVTNSLVYADNREHFSPKSPSQGGLKITKSRNVVFSHNVVRDNPGMSGVWFDQSSYNLTIVGNRVTHNGRIGVYTELSSVILVADNYLVGNGQDQIRIFDSNQVRVWNNTVGDGACSRTIGITQDTRRASNTSLPGHDNRRPLPDPTVTWIAGDVTIKNNIIGSGAQHHIYVMDKSAQRSATQMNVVVDGNLFSPQPLHYDDVAWGSSDGVDYTKYVTAPQVNASPADGTTNDDNSSPMTAEQLAASPEASSTTVPHALPTSIADVIGVPAGTRHLGSF